VTLVTVSRRHELARQQLRFTVPTQNCLDVTNVGDIQRELIYLSVGHVSL